MSSSIIVTRLSDGNRVLIDVNQIATYRGNTGFTTIYLLNDEVLWVKETFEEVDDKIHHDEE